MRSLPRRGRGRGKRRVVYILRTASTESRVKEFVLEAVIFECAAPDTPRGEEREREREREFLRSYLRANKTYCLITDYAKSCYLNMSLYDASPRERWPFETHKTRGGGTRGNRRIRTIENSRLKSNLITVLASVFSLLVPHFNDAKIHLRQ